MTTVRLTVGQAVVRFLAAQRSERDGTQHRLIEGCFGIFGHGNVAGLGQGLLEAELDAEPARGLQYLQGRNEQAMVHAAAAFARTRNRMSTLACTSSIGPGATNMVTGAALATINRLPVLLLPGDVFATRVADPVLQQLEQPNAQDISVNDAFRPVSRFFDRVWRPEQLPSALLAAMRVLTDPAETGAVTLALPQDVQAEAYDWPAELFRERVWHIPRTPPDPAAVTRAAEVIRSARRPLIVAGGGVIYSEATHALKSFADAFGIPVGQTQAGKGTMRSDDPLCAGAIGATGTTAANELAARADVVIGIGTRWSDFTTASRSRVRRAGSAVRQHQRGVVRRGQAVRGGGGGRRPGRARRPGPGPGRVDDGARPPGPGRGAVGPLAGDGRGRLHHPAPAAARAGRGHRRGQRGVRGHRRRPVRGRVDAR